ncbi:DUF3566 domain-containing protein [Mycobacterium bohemicum]|uniref:DUF3566 domain-containing protein n=1 Tax=Mycobacterium bohemicum TaxID=56425 RepID=A0A1X1RAY7_MYCBE|nr:DUF3566 domain-containing protein [Mycobacterium bohemicum]MCV6972827.1 DUF3566 domain-containing protein [Mycobacterium bohemicum]ORV02372.1 hypothetical protein AWB93_06035 [Mycobacterium bohemicum]
MSSPNEPGAPNQGDSPNGEGSADRAGAHHRTTPAQAGRIQDGGDLPPRQRAARPAPPSGADARLNRFISGSAAPSSGGPARSDGPPGEAYASELPDLSGPIPRAAQRPTPPERSPEPTAATGPARSATTEARESRVQVARRGRGPVRASMQIRRIDPWSTLKVSLLLSVALFFVWMIAVAFLYLVLGGMGVWAKLNSNVGDLLNNTSGSNSELISTGTIFGGAVLIGLVNIVLLTAMATIAAFVYNLTTDLIGGIEVTLADRD